MKNESVVKSFLISIELCATLRVGLIIIKMSFFSSKTSLVNTGLLYGMTDIHSHILPGVDDGVVAFNEAVKSLQWLKSVGIHRIYLTPHIMTDFSKNNYEYISEQYELFKDKLINDGIGDIPEMKLGAEYMLEFAFEKHKNERLLTYNNNHILVETSYITPPVGFLSILEKLLCDGFSPVLAHPERYVYLDIKDCGNLKKQGILFQLNFLSLTGAYGSLAKEKASQLLQKGYYNYAGSDFHNLARHEKYYSLKSFTDKQIASLRILIYNNTELW